MEEKILLVDDDAKLRKLLTEYLEGYGYRVLTAPDGLNIQERLREGAPDIVILDIMLPQKDGLEVLREIRSEHAIPVIMLTAKGEEADRIVGLELGADDYLPKPFNPRELLARIKAVLRRLIPRAPAGAVQEETDSILLGSMTLDRLKRALFVDGDEIELSATEFSLLEALMSRPNAVMSRDRLMNLARGRDFIAFDRSVDVHVSKLRAKLEPYPSCKDVIKTVWGVGYMFVDQP